MHLVDDPVKIEEIVAATEAELGYAPGGLGTWRQRMEATAAEVFLMEHAASITILAMRIGHGREPTKDEFESWRRVLPRLLADTWSGPPHSAGARARLIEIGERADKADEANE